MECRTCGEKAVQGRLCRKHFCEDIEARVQDTIDRFNLFERNAKILVAISGGKDSQVLLIILKRLGYSVDALLIDEGIADYRRYTVEDAKQLCAEFGVRLNIVTFRDEYGRPLDDMLKSQKNPCTVCGTLRRHMLNRYAQGYDCIATGHNLDDEAQAVLMNICTGRLELLPRLGPISGSAPHTKFVRRVKPLYLVSEKETRTYAFLRELHISPKECPHIPDSFRAQLREWLNAYAADHPRAKRNVVDWYLARDFQGLAQEGSIDTCPACGFPSKEGLCKACTLQEDLVF